MKFKVKRDSGKSNSEVLIDFVKDFHPGHIFTYDVLSNVLSAGTDRQYDVAEVQRIVASATSRLLKEQAIALHNIRYTGYRLAPASYHITLAGNRQNKADKQMRLGVQTLQNVRWHELSENERLAHQGQLLITSALYNQIRSLEKRQSAIESAIRNRDNKPPDMPA